MWERQIGVCDRIVKQLIDTRANGRNVMANPVDEAASSAIAAFAIAQLSMWALFKSGLLTKGEAEQMLKQAVEANKVGAPANQLAAAKLEAVLQSMSSAPEFKQH